MKLEFLCACIKPEFLVINPYIFVYIFKSIEISGVQKRMPVWYLRLQQFWSSEATTTTTTSNYRALGYFNSTRFRNQFCATELTSLNSFQHT